MNRLHDDEVEVTLDLVRHLIRTQFPQFEHLPIKPVDSLGTVNHIYRLGDELSIRLPRSQRVAKGIACERDCLPRLEGKLPLRIPCLAGSGQPTADYPCEWAIMDWIPGAPYLFDDPPDEIETATRLGGFVRALQQIATEDAPRSTRDAPLIRRDALAREAIAEITEFDQLALIDRWERCLAAPAWNGQPVWTHADLLPPNLIVENGHLTAVIDFGHPGAGDPALDFGPAWTVFSKVGRVRFREAAGASDDDWQRAQGLALFQALLIIPYYRNTNPGFTATAVRTVGEMLNDQ